MQSISISVFLNIAKKKKKKMLEKQKNKKMLMLTVPKGCVK